MPKTTTRATREDAMSTAAEIRPERERTDLLCAHPFPMHHENRKLA
jgi:hypothetical protein